MRCAGKLTVSQTALLLGTWKLSMHMLCQLNCNMKVRLLAKAERPSGEKRDSLEVAKVTLIQLGDAMAGTARLATLYVVLEGMKLPAAFCRCAV